VSGSEQKTATDVVRRLVPADAVAYRARMLDAYERHRSAFTSTAAERGALPLRWWEERLAPGGDTADVVYGAFDAGRLVGAAGLSFERRERARHKATLFGMSVAESARQAGFGRRLVQLTVTEGNDAAQRLYERCGFRPFGVEPLAIALDGQLLGKVHMWCDLQQPNHSPS
jgi:RimJ/RimL family protein N-acetyltransferase